MRRLLAFGFVLAALPAFAQAPTVTVSGDGAATVVSVGTQGPPGASASTAGIIADVKLYGALGNGTTDDSAGVIAAIAAVSTAGGGIVYFPVGTYRIDSQLAIPQSGDTNKSIRLTGAGGWFDGLWGGAQGASQLDLRYASGPKIYTIGKGVLEIDHLTLKDTTDGTQSFVFTSYTTVMIHDNGFFGKTPTTPVQDAIVLGDRTPGAPLIQYKFGGYGTVITANYFQNIRRAVFAQKFTASVVITNNTVASGSGANAAAAAFEFDGVDGPAGGFTVTGNLIEIPNYVYGIRLTWVRQSFFQNSFYDPGAGFTSEYYVPVASTGNVIIAGEGDTSYYVTSGAGQESNTLIDNRHGSWFTKPVRFEMGTTTPTGQTIGVNEDASAAIYSDGSKQLWFRANNLNAAVITTTGAISTISGFYLGGPLYVYSPTTQRFIDFGLNGGRSGMTLAELGTPHDGIVAYCSDCAPQSSPCTATSTGALAVRLNGAWDCR